MSRHTPCVMRPPPVPEPSVPSVAHPPLQLFGRPFPLLCCGPYGPVRHLLEEHLHGGLVVDPPDGLPQ
eukprot:5295413-Pyramimonas_sp.AAC.1